jgi:hypothetical protein
MGLNFVASRYLVFRKPKPAPARGRTLAPAAEASPIAAEPELPLRER